MPRDNVEALPDDKVYLLDDSQILWGPVCLDPLQPPTKMPFPGALGKLKIDPLPHGTGVTLSDEDFTTNLRFEDALYLIENVRRVGWTEALRTIRRKGTRTVLNVPSRGK
jgi:hypothetical protein